MLKLEYTAKFKKDFKRAKRQGRDLEKLKKTLELLANQVELPQSYRDHALEGSYRGHRELHIEPDWLLIYRLDEGRLVLAAVRLGSHSELLGL